MQTKVRYLTPLLGVVAAAVAFTSTPIANASSRIIPNRESCTGAVCQSPGNVQVNDNPPPVSFYPYGGEAFLLGGGGFGGGGRR
jgi:hypothetical protein